MPLLGVRFGDQPAHYRERTECTPTRSGRKVGWTCSISVGLPAQ
jgi:hypothetical protein